MRRWYLVHTKRSGEIAAESNLVRQQYEVYFPRLRQRVRRRKRWEDQIVPLFPRYLFLCLNEGRQSLTPIRSTLGVACVVRCGFAYAIVPDRIVEELCARADPASGLHRLNSERQFISGTAVKVTGGMFDGLQGVFERQGGADRVVILLNLLGHYASVQVSADLVAPVYAT